MKNEQEQAKDHFRYVMYGTIDKPQGLDPKGEFFCRYRENWMPEIDGKIAISTMKNGILTNCGRNIP